MSQTVLTKTGFLLMALAVCSGCSESSPAPQQPRGRAVPEPVSRMAQVKERAPVAFSEDTWTVSLEAPGSIWPLGPGDDAPRLQLSKFVQGKNVDDFQEGHIYIVQFWATWCSTCLQTLPYVAELQNKYSDDVTVIAITAETEEKVSSFLLQKTDGQQTWGDVLTFPIALDDERKTQAIWRKTFQDESLPFVMIVGRTGLIEWSGHPVDMANPLKAIAEGSWDLKLARRIMREDVEGQRSIDSNQQFIVTAVNAGNYREAVGITDRMLKKLPNNRKILSLQKQLLIDGKIYNRMNKVFAKLVQLNNHDAAELNAIAWNICAELDTPKRDLDLALKAAQRASELTEHQRPEILETVARAYYERGELQDAVDWQEKAVEIEPTSVLLSQVLEDYLSELSGEAAEN